MANQFADIIERNNRRVDVVAAKQNREEEVFSIFNEEIKKYETDIREIFEGLDRFARVNYIGNDRYNHMLAAINRGGYRYEVYASRDYSTKTGGRIRVGFEASTNNLTAKTIKFDFDETDQQLRIKFKNAIRAFITIAYGNGPSKN